MTVLMEKKKRRVATGLAVAIGLVVIAYGGICFVIGSGVEAAVWKARLSFPGDPAEALISMAMSEDIPLKDRNRAIWAVGQLGDVRALVPLGSLLTGKPCDHSSAVCQYEVKKALRLCRGGANLTRWTWRRSVL
jgi:hypothetical protein